MWSGLWGPFKCARPRIQCASLHTLLRRTHSYSGKNQLAVLVQKCLFEREDPSEASKLIESNYSRENIDKAVALLMRYWIQQGQYQEAVNVFEKFFPIHAQRRSNCK